MSDVIDFIIDNTDDEGLHSLVLNLSLKDIDFEFTTFERLARKTRNLSELKVKGTQSNSEVSKVALT